MLSRNFFSSSGAAGGIVTGSDGNIWFTDLIGNSIWRLELPTRALTSFPVPTPSSFPSDITLGADGNLWFVEGVGKIGRITPQGVITEFGTDLSLPFSIATGPDGNVWFTQRFKPEIGKITPAGRIHILSHTGFGRGNCIWFLGFGNDKVYRVNFAR